MTVRYGVTTGHVVKAFDDEKGQGRVRVRLDRLADGGAAPEVWAPVATLMTGGKRGSWFMPEVGDQVLLAMDHGDINHVYVVGYLWNGKDQPPSDGIDEHTRRLRSVSGHLLEFNDTKGSEQVHLETQGKHQLTLDDKAGQAAVTVLSKNGHQMKIEDQQNTIELKTRSGVKISLDDLSGKIDITTTTGEVTVECLSASVTAQTSLDLTANASISLQTPGALSIQAGALNVQAPLSSFEGVVQVLTLIANAVVSSAYTPAPGDTLGL